MLSRLQEKLRKANEEFEDLKKTVERDVVEPMRKLERDALKVLIKELKEYV